MIIQRTNFISVKRGGITYEELAKNLSSKFSEFIFKIKSGTYERYILVKTPYLFVGFNIWYSAQDKTLELTNTIPLLLLETRSRDRRPFAINYKNQRSGTNILLLLNSNTRQRVRSKVFNFLIEKYSI